MSAQKADALSGIICILLAFLIQVISLIFVSNGNLFIEDRWIGVLVVLAIVSFITIILCFINKIVFNFYKFEMGKMEIKNYFDRSFHEMIKNRNITTLETMLRELLNLNKKDSETKNDFIRRITKLTGWSIPEDVDLSRINGNN